MNAIPLDPMFSDTSRPDLQHTASSSSDLSDHDILSMVYGFADPRQDPNDHPQYEFITERSTRLL